MCLLPVSAPSIACLFPSLPLTFLPPSLSLVKARDGCGVTIWGSSNPSVPRAYYAQLDAG